MRRDVRGRVVLITGASRGIGRRLAGRLADRGARVALTARSADELDVLVRQLTAAGLVAAAFPADLTKPHDRERVVRGVVGLFGGLDVLVNCAGVCSFGEFATSSEDVLRKVLEINFFAPVELIRLAQPHLMQSLAGGYRPAVLNVASICGRCGIPSLPEHCASKHALVGMSEGLRAEFARYDLDVLLVLPGLVRSDNLKRHLLRNEGRIHLDFDGAQPADDVAAEVERCLMRNRTETAVGYVSWGVWLGKRLWPRGVRWFMQRKCVKYERRVAATQSGA